MKKIKVHGALLAVLFLFIMQAAFSLETLVVQEGELVKLNLDIVDPDGDSLSVTFSPPLDENGTWQTTFEDAGEYEVAAFVTDGKVTTQETIDIIVEDVNRAPTILIEENVSAQELDIVTLRPDVSDADGDEVTLTYEAPFDDEGVWETTYEDAGTYLVTITASDDKDEATATTTINLEELNREPKIQEFRPQDTEVSLPEDSSIAFSVEADDLDEDELTYTWVLDGENVSAEDDFLYTADFDSSGEHTVLVSVSDGKDSILQKWEIIVENVNRAPSLASLEDLVVKENETIVIDLPKTDIDGDELSYTIEEPFDAQLSWEPTFKDAGFISVRVEASDGDLSVEKTIDIEVLNVDRPPVVNPLGKLELSEGEKITFEIKAQDPDGDNVELTMKGLPQEATFVEGVVEWQPDKDTVLKPANVFTSLLGKLRLDKRLYQEKKFPITIEGCSNGLCMSQQAVILVKNTNRAPRFDNLLPDVISNESSVIRLRPVSVDDDNDHLRYYYTEPFDKSGTWKTSFDDTGTYTITVGATDGRESVEQTIKVTILNKNRAPEFNKIGDRKVNEGETVFMFVEPTDPDGDNLTVRVEDPPTGSTFVDKLFTWTPAHHFVSKSGGFINELVSKNDFLNRKLSQEKFVKVVAFAAFDGEDETVKNVAVTIRNKNLAPEILNASPSGPIQVPLGVPVVFSIVPHDPDLDNFTVEWNFGLNSRKIRDVNAVQRTYVRQGVKKVKVTLDDGRDSITHEFVVEVRGRVQVPVQQPPQPIAPPIQQRLIFDTKVI